MAIVTKDYSQLGPTMKEVKDVTLKWLLLARREVVVDLVTDLARNTPVDTSQALSNWEVKRDSTFSFGSAHVKGSKGSTREASIALTRAAARRESDKIPLNATIFIGNAAPYIRRLDQGYSKQRPRPQTHPTCLLYTSPSPRD